MQFASQTPEPVPAAPVSRPATSKRPWHPPVLEPLGAWRALTLQQSIPIGPGNL